MQALSQDDLRNNEQAANVAASVVGEPIEAAARAEQITQDQQMAAVGVGGLSRGFMKGSKGLSKVMMPKTMGDMGKMESGGLPKTFVLAVSKTKVYAIEHKESGGQLVAGKLLKEWDREGFRASASDPSGIQAQMSGIPEDRRPLTIFIPIEGAKSKYMQAAANVMATAGAGMPTKLMVAKDSASQKLIDAIASGAAAATVIVNGQIVSGPGAPAAPSSVDQLTQLAALHQSGVLSDAEFAQQKSRILGAS
jgi:hypothetical protein